MQLLSKSRIDKAGLALAKAKFKDEVPEFDSYRRNYLILLEAVLKIATTARRAAPAVVVL